MNVTFVSDGSSDRALIPAIRWLLTEHGVGDELDIRWADFRYMKVPPVGLQEKIQKALELYPCDLLFVHRDAENVPHEDRSQEIRQILEKLEAEGEIEIPAVCVVPIRMTEAWLLVEESAIRRASGNPEGRMPLSLPKLRQIESRPNPKKILFDALRKASGQTGRRLAKLDFRSLRYRVADLISDYTKLRMLAAFRSLEAEVIETLPNIL